MRAALSYGHEALVSQLGGRAGALGAAPRALAPPIYAPVLDHLDAELGALHRELTGAENTYDAAGPALAELRRQRDDLVAGLRALVAPIPRALRAHPGLDRAALPGAPPESPDALAKYLTDTLDFLRHLGSNPRVAQIIEAARAHASRTVNTAASSEPIFPVVRSSFLVRHRENEDTARIDAVYQAVRKLP